MMNHHLLIDIGNTFLKWGFYRKRPPGEHVLAQEQLVHFGRVLHDEIPTVMAKWRSFAAPSRIVVSNVAGTLIRNPLMRALEIWPQEHAPYWIASQLEQCGVRNGYLNPAALGCDRWSALIGARALIPDAPVLVVVCGTATTVDLLTADGRFLGGGIMPGLGLMQRVLHQHTATLPDAQGDYLDFPRQTVDAIATGCTNAQAGAVERVFAMHAPEHPGLQCIISGGAARTLAPRLGVNHRVHENLVLDGLYWIAESLGS